MPNFLPNNQDSIAYKELEDALLRQKNGIYLGDGSMDVRCKKVAEGIYKQCECSQLQQTNDDTPPGVAESQVHKPWSGFAPGYQASKRPSRYKSYGAPRQKGYVARLPSRRASPVYTDFVAPKDRLHDIYVTSRPMKEWHNIDSYVCKLLENNPGFSENECFVICCRSLSSLSKQVPDWPNSISKYASTLLSKWKGPEKQHWLEIAKKVIQRKRDEEKVATNNAEIQQKEIIQQQRTTVSAINLVTEEIDERSRKRQRGQEPQSDYYNEEKVSKKQAQEGPISPSPNSQISVSLPEENNPFFDEEDEDEDIVIDDVPSEFSFENGDLENGIYVGETNVSLLFRNYQVTSLDLAKIKGNIFQQISLDSNSEATFRKAVKMAMNGSRNEAINRLCGDLSNEKSLRDNLGFVVWTA
ncbi:11948_t:CDS:2 [Funneliformis geosporum]|nr:11948_t:CDS:2 [Funneliformis geosporum]